MQIQAETLDKQFEKPLRQHLENYRTIVTVGFTRTDLFASNDCEHPGAFQQL